MKLYAGIDLHSRNNYLAVVTRSGKRIMGKKMWVQKFGQHVKV